METELEAMMVGGWVKGDRAKLNLRVSSFPLDNLIMRRISNGQIHHRHHLWSLAPRAEGSRDCRGTFLDCIGSATCSVTV